jgi:hypothetical protein
MCTDRNVYTYTICYIVLNFLPKKLESDKILTEKVNFSVRF